MFISNHIKKETIDEYAQLTTQIREQYGKLQKENNNLQIELQKYKKYVEQIQTRNKKNIMKTHLEKENTINEIMNKTIQMMIATRT